LNAGLASGAPRYPEPFSSAIKEPIKYMYPPRFFPNRPLGCFLAALGMTVMPIHASLSLAEGGRTEYVIVQSEGATSAERQAASELAQTLRQITGAKFEVRTEAAEIPRRAIVVGPGALAAKLFPEVPFLELGDEEIVLRTHGQHLLIAGGRPRGTLYAVARFLQDYGGARWWTPWASTIPHRAHLTIPRLQVRARPVFESRDPYWLSALLFAPGSPFPEF
jgi:hypothetical protein